MAHADNTEARQSPPESVAQMLSSCPIPPFQEVMRQIDVALQLAAAAHQREVMIMRERADETSVTTSKSVFSAFSAGAQKGPQELMPGCQELACAHAASGRSTFSLFNGGGAAHCGQCAAEPAAASLPCGMFRGRLRCGTRRNSDGQEEDYKRAKPAVRRCKSTECQASGTLQEVVPCFPSYEVAGRCTPPHTKKVRSALRVPKRRPSILSRRKMAPTEPATELPGMLDFGIPSDSAQVTEAELSSARSSHSESRSNKLVGSKPDCKSLTTAASLPKESRRTRKCSVKEAALLGAWDLDSEWGPEFNVEVSLTMEPSLSSRAMMEPTTPRVLPIRRLFKCSVIHPQSNPRLCFDILALMVMVYDIIMIPVHIAFQPEEDPVMDIMEWVTTFFWIVDVILSFNTGYNTSNGDLIMRRRQVIQNYLQSWFGVDVCVLAPELFIAFDRQTSSKAAGALKAMRFVRLLRVLRLMKVDKILRDMKARINSNSFLLGLAILRHIFCLSVLIHIVACVWYGLGTQPDGWVVSHGLGDCSLRHKYLTSLHWSLTQFHGSTNINPNNELERLLAVLVLLMALILFSSFLSSITNLMMQLSNLRYERTVHLQELYRFLEDHNISSSLSVRVKKYVEAKATQQQKEHDVEFLRLLPPHLMLDLHDEVRNPVLTGNPFLAQLREKHPRVLRQLCHEAVAQACFQREDSIFAKNDCTQKMFFIEWGMARYFHGGRPRQRRNKIKKGHSVVGMNCESLESLPQMMKQAFTRSFTKKLTRSSSGLDCLPEEDGNIKDFGRSRWLAEAALWTRWEHKGDLEAMTSSSVLMLSVKDFLHVVEAYEVARIECAVYAQAFVNALRDADVLSDHMDFRVTRKSAVQ